MTMFRKKSKKEQKPLRLIIFFYLSRHKGFGNNPEKKKDKISKRISEKMGYWHVNEKDT